MFRKIKKNHAFKKYQPRGKVIFRQFSRVNHKFANFLLNYICVNEKKNRGFKSHEKVIF